MEVGSFTIIATPYSLFPPVFARGIFELSVNKGVNVIRGFVEEVKDAGIQKGLFRNSFFVYGTFQSCHMPLRLSRNFSTFSSRALLSCISAQKPLRIEKHDERIRAIRKNGMNALFKKPVIRMS
jgi:hypothetical protein